MSYKKILVPVDFSDCAKNAVETAIHFAKYFDAELIFQHAFQIPVTHGEPGAGALVNDISADLDKEARGDLEVLYSKYPELSEVTYSQTVTHGYPVDSIVAAAEKSEADLILMGTMGASGLEEKLIGSVTSGVIHRADCPVIALPPDTSLQVVKHIVLAGDYQSMQDLKILDPLRELAVFFNADIHILHVGENDFKLPAGEMDEAKRLERYMKDLPHSFHYIKNEDVEEGINEYLEEHNIDLLVMIPRKHRLFERLFKESLTKKMACHTKTPMMALH